MVASCGDLYLCYGTAQDVDCYCLQQAPRFASPRACAMHELFCEASGLYLRLDLEAGESEAFFHHPSG